MFLRSIILLAALTTSGCSLMQQHFANTDRATLSASYELVKPFVEIGIEVLVEEGELTTFEGADLQAKMAELSTALLVGDLDRAKAVSWPTLQALAEAGLQVRVLDGKMSQVDADLIVALFGVLGAFL